MKKASILILSALLCAGKPKNDGIKCSITDYRKTKEKAPDNTLGHKNEDVIIFRTNFIMDEVNGNAFIRDTYSVIAYHIDNGELKGHQTFYESKNDFDEAIYAWKNDSTVSVKLLSSKSKIAESFSMIGKGNRTSLILDK